MNAQLPRRSGGFELQRELGRGGMGVVYQAQELSSGRVVALKVLLAEHSVSEEAFERFQREARIAASISDSRCVFVYGAHQIDDSPAISMELVGGETLEHKLARGESIPIQTAVRWTLDILDGLEAASMAGVVHRDVKPSNCFVTDSGQVKVGDFGLARTFEADLRLTLTGQFLGSPLYASPEQIKGRDVDARSDLYSCGATLYALLAGRPPHTGTNLGEVLSRILSEPPTPLRTIRPEIPRSLERVVLQAMERDPKRRFQTHADMRAALLPFIAGGERPANPLRRGIAYLTDVALLLLLDFVLGALGPWLGVEELARDRAVGACALLLVPWVYFAALETFAGASAGKWLCGLRVRTEPGRDGRAWVPLRALVFESPKLVAGMASLVFAVEATGPRLLLALAPPLVMLVFFVTARPWNGWRGAHEFVSRTRVVQRRTPYASVARSAPPDRSPLTMPAGMPARIGRYTIQGCVGRTPSGLLLEARDDELQRSVWILRPDGLSAPLADARRSCTRAGRLRWLDTSTVDGTTCEIFEAPGGASLRACSERRATVSWSRIAVLLTSLVDELEESGGESVSLEQLWVDGSWNLRVLDEPLGEEAARGLAPAELVIAAARTLLPDKSLLPADLPEHAEDVARRLFGAARPFASLSEASSALHSLDGRAAHVARRTRAAQLALNAGPAALVTVCLALGLVWVLPRAIAVTEAHRMAEQLQTGLVEERGATSTSPAVSRPLSDDEREARAILIGAADDASLGLQLGVNSAEGSDAHYQRATEKHPSPSRDEIEWAKAHFGPGFPDTESSLEPLNRALPVLPLTILVFWGFFASAAAFTLRGGLSFRVFDLRLRDRRGRLASRWRCLLRSAIVWMPLALAYLAALYFGTTTAGYAGLALLALTVVLHATAVVFALVNPARGLQDWITGTRIVPR